MIETILRKDILKLEWGSWEVITRKGRFEKGGRWEEELKLRVAKTRNPSITFEEGIVLSDKDIDKEGNERGNTLRGYHYIAALQNDVQIYFMFSLGDDSKMRWRVLSDDCVSFCRDFPSKISAITKLIELTTAF